MQTVHPSTISDPILVSETQVVIVIGYKSKPSCRMLCSINGLDFSLMHDKCKLQAKGIIFRLLETASIIEVVNLKMPDSKKTGTCSILIDGVSLSDTVNVKTKPLFNL